MSASQKVTKRNPAGVKKCPSGIPGLDQITGGGYPVGRSTLICGGTGTGKTLLGMQFLVKGIVEYGEPGVFMSFEESPRDLAANVASLGFDLDALAEEKKFLIDHVRIERVEIEETGEYDLEGLFVRLGYDIDSIGAKRVVLDTIETLFACLANEGILRSELQRLFRWLKDKGVTVIITAERGEGSLTRHGLEEYVSDCVILLDQRISGQVATRHLRIVKYRGSSHGTNEYPFLLDDKGFTLVPVTSIGLSYSVSREVISSGIPKLDAMLGAGGYYRGSTLLVSGAAGSGKTSVSAHFVDAACRRGEHSLYFSFEESPDQLVRNMLSIGIDLKQWQDRELLQLKAARPPSNGLDAHLAMLRTIIDELKPQVVVLDPISSLEVSGNLLEARTMLMCLIDILKSQGITALFTSLTDMERNESGVATLIDSWLLLRNMEFGGERTRALYILKARGMSHSNKVREFVLTEKGIDLVDVYVGPGGVLTGSARAVQELEDRSVQMQLQQETERQRLLINSKQAALESKIAAMKAEFEAERSEVEKSISDANARARNLASGRAEIAEGHNGGSR